MNILPSTGTFLRIVIILFVAAGAHRTVVIVRRIGDRILTAKRGVALRKLKSIASLATSIIVFSLYFGAFGFILHELGVSLTAYLASA